MEPGSQSHPSAPVALPLNGCSSTSSFLHHHNQQSHASPITTDASTVAHSPPLFVLRAPCSQGGGSGSCSPLLSAGVKVSPYTGRTSSNRQDMALSDLPCLRLFVWGCQRKEVGGSRGGGSCMPSSLNVSRARSHPHMARPQPLQLNLLNEQHHYMHMHQHNTSPSLLPPQANPHARSVTQPLSQSASPLSWPFNSFMPCLRIVVACGGCPDCVSCVCLCVCSTGCSTC